MIMAFKINYIQRTNHFRDPEIIKAELIHESKDMSFYHFLNKSGGIIKYVNKSVIESVEWND